MNALQMTLLVLGCGTATDPMLLQTQSYVEDVTVLLQQSENIERKFVTMAGKISQETLTPQEAHEALTADLLPASEQLLGATNQLTTESSELKVLHAELEDAWRARDKAWRDMLSAWQSGDVAQLTRAMEDRDSARNAEERFIYDVNAVLRPYGHQLRLYP